MSSEYTEMCLTSLSHTFRIIVVYQPPPASTNCFTVSMFIEEFSRFLEHKISTSASLLILGDFNFHIEDNTNYEAGCFKHLLESFCLHEHVSGPTHKGGHTLDIISHLHITLPNIISDYSALHFKIPILKPSWIREDI